MAAFAVGGQRDVMNIAKAQQGVDIRFVGLGGQWVTQEDDVLNFFGGHQGTNLLVAAEWAGHHGFDIEPQFFVEQSSRGMGGYQMELG